MKVNNHIIKRISIALIAAMAVVPSCTRESTTVFEGAGDSPLSKSSDTQIAWGIQKNFRKIYDLYKDRVVEISAERVARRRRLPFHAPYSRQRKRIGLGTGFVLSEDGYICTAYHVVAPANKITVKVNGRSHIANIVGIDERTDIALLKIDPGEPLKAVFMGDSDEVRVGDLAIAIGNPFGLDKTFTMGAISATARRDVDFMGSSQSHIQTDASINPGNSGGPLININGQVIGINRMIFSKSGGYTGIGFAIPINTAKLVLSHLKKFKKVKRGFIGVQIIPLNENLAQRLGRSNIYGALVVEVLRDSPACRGGLRRGDIILKVNNSDIIKYGNFVEVIGKSEIGSHLKISVWRRKKSITLRIKIAERPQ